MSQGDIEARGVEAQTDTRPAERRRNAAGTSRLRQRARQQAAIAALGQAALSGTPPGELMDEAVRLLRDIFRVDFAKVLELSADGERLVVRAGAGWPAGVVGVVSVGSGVDSQAGYTLVSDVPVIVDDLTLETRFRGPQVLLDAGVVSGMSAVIRGRDGPWGVLGVHARRTRRFTTDDANVLAAAANILAMAIERARTERALAESEQRMRTLVDTAPDVIFTVRPDRRLASLNPAFERVLGWPRGQWLDREFDAIVHPSDLPRAHDLFRRVMGGEAPPVFELRILRADGRHAEFEFSVTPERDGAGTVSGVLGIGRDVTEHKRKEHEQRGLMQALDLVTDAMPVSLSFVEPDGRYRWTNRDNARRFGYEPGELVGRSIAETHGDDYRSIEPYYRRAIAGEEVHYERTRIARDGTVSEVEGYMIPMRDAAGTIEGICALGIDITGRKREERERQRSLSLLQATLEATYDGILVVDETGRVVTANRRYSDLWRLPPGTLEVGQPAARIACVADQLCDPQGFAERVNALYADPEAESYDVVHFRDGRVLERFSRPQRIDGRPVGRVWSFRDVTSRQLAQDALRESQRLLERAQQAAHLGIWHSEPDAAGRVSWSAETHAIFGTSPDSFDGRFGSFIGLVHPEDRAAVSARFARAVSGDSAYDIDYRILRRDGTVRWVHDQADVLRGPSGDALEVVGVCRDITERKLAEQALRESEARSRFLARIVEQSEDSILTRNLDDVITSWNKGTERLFGYTAEEAIGRTSRDLHMAHLTDAEYAVVRERLQAARPARYEARRVTKTGETVYIHSAVSPLYDEYGRHVGELAIARDMTGLRRAEQAARESAETLRLALEGGRIINWDWDVAADRIVWGASPEWLLGPLPPGVTEYPDFRMLVHPDDRAHFVSVGQAAIANGTSYECEFRLVRTDGQIRWIHAKGRTIAAADGTVTRMVGVSQDMTERNRIQSALRESEERYRRLVDATPNAIIVHRAGIVTLANEAAVGLYGACSQEDLVGKRVLDFYPAKFVPLIEDRIRQVESGVNTPLMEQQIVRLDGSLVDVETTAIPFIDRGELYVIVVQRDITERKRVETALKQMNEELERRVSDRTSALESAHKEAETLSYSIAHDLRAPLRAISGYSRILIEDIGERLPVEAGNYLSRMHENAVRMGTLIDALLSFGRLSRTPIACTRVRLDDVVSDVLAWLGSEQVGRNVHIVRRDLGYVQADPALLRLALANLLSNALKFTRHRDPAEIEVGIETDEGRRAFFVRDNGAGFDMRFVDKLFGVFQRLHGQDEFEGSGVGLASVQRIVQRHEGRIWAKSEPGRGATFYFTLAGADALRAPD